MKRLTLVLAAVLVGCPNWDDLTEEQCRQLGASTGVCAKFATDAGAGGGGGETGGGGGETGGGTTGGGGGTTGGGGGTTGGGGGTTGGGGGTTGGGGGTTGGGGGTTGGGGGTAGLISWDGGSVSYGALAVLTVSSTQLTANDITTTRRPILVTEMPANNWTATIEDEGSAGFVLWVSSSAANRGNSPNRGYSAAANDRSWFIGTATDASKLTVDSISPSASADWNFAGSVPATAHLLTPDGGPAFVGAFVGGNTVVLSAACSNCAPNTMSSGVADAVVDCATADGANMAWFSLRVGTQPAAREVRVLRSTATLGMSQITFPGSSTSARTLIAGSTASDTRTMVHVAWTSGDLLHLAGMQNSMVDHDDVFDFSEPIELLALSNNGPSTVAVLGVAGRHVMLIHRHSEPPEFVYLDTNTSFRPSASHLRTRLRLAGACAAADGGLVNCNGNSNHVLLFETRPDGGSW